MPQEGSNGVVDLGGVEGTEPAKELAGISSRDSTLTGSNPADLLSVPSLAGSTVATPCPPSGQTDPTSAPTGVAAHSHIAAAPPADGTSPTQDSQHPDPLPPPVLSSVPVPGSGTAEDADPQDAPPLSSGDAGPRPSSGVQPQLSLGAHADAAIAALEASLAPPPDSGSPESGAAPVGDVEGPASGRQDEGAHPLLVFINSKSGGRMGPSLMAAFQRLVGKSRVFDLSVDNPSTVLSVLLQRLDAQAVHDPRAATTRKAMRILVCGGDGTVGWVLASLESLHQEQPPPVGVIPLGTGNDLARVFGWGASFMSTKPARVAAYLEQVAAATPSLMDNWQVELFPADAAPLSLPHALHPHQLRPVAHLVPQQEGLAQIHGYRGGFWNYFSLGMDAHTAYAFHHLRERKPWLARGQKINQALYAHYGCAQGWFCLGCPCSGASDVSAVARIKYCGKDGVWHPLPLAANVRAVVVLNLQSYAGGRNPWGRPSQAVRDKYGFVPAAFDDGLLEVVALTGGWHTAAVMAKAAHARRLVQARSLVVELHGEGAPRCYLQMDGEPWVQPCDPAKPSAVLSITHSGQSVLLAKQGSKVRSNTLGQTTPQVDKPAPPPAEVVGRAKELERQKTQRTTGGIELVQQEREAAVEQTERRH